MELLDDDKDPPFLNKGLVDTLLKQHFTNKKCKIKADSLWAVKLTMETFVSELLTRTIKAAVEDLDNDTDINVTADHLKQVLPQHLLDFA